MSEFVFSTAQTTTLTAATAGDLLSSSAGVEPRDCDEVAITVYNAGAATIETIYVVGSAYPGSSQFVNISTSMALTTGSSGTFHLSGYRGGPIRVVGTSASGSAGVVCQAGFFKNHAASSQFSIAVNGIVTSETAAGATTMRSVEFFSPVAKGATVHAQVAAGAAVAISSGFTVAFPARGLTITRGGAGSATVYTVTGTRLGAAQTETFTSAGAADIVGVKVWDTITSVTSDVDPAVTSDFITNDLVGLQTTALAIDRAGCAASAVANYVVETATLNTLKDAVTFTTATNGAKYFRVQYTHSHSHT